MPIGALATVDDGRLTLRGVVASLDGARVIRAEEAGPAEDAVAIGRRAAAVLASRGAGAVLAEVRRAAYATAPAAP